ncbi:hypothetical protein HPB49_002580 [Dermacentor silvarum]|uniref:Uncharacterized protein n=1 Tax=Dermacentor silvarum TaxID=543639 RepID=A0ACB8DAC5_DERSI|nr:hypothetical protein HPB49_002580 [Dermacentor silvarum]
MNRYVILVQVLLKHGEMQLSAMPTTYVDERRMQRAECALRGRCNREKPPCKYFHPPQHLKDQLLINGRNHLALKNALLQQMPLQAMLPGQLPTAAVATSPYMPALTTMATASSFGHYLTPSPVLPGMMTADAVTAPLSVVPASLVSPQKVARTDRLEVCREFQRGTCKRPETECRFGHPPEHVAVDSGDGAVTVCMDFVKGRCSRDQCRYFHPPPHLQAQLKATQSRAGAAAAAAAAAMATEGGSTDVGLQMYTQCCCPESSLPHLLAQDLFDTQQTVYEVFRPNIVALPGLVPYTKRPALDKSGVPVYQPSATAYQQALALQMQQPFVPVSLPTMPSVTLVSAGVAAAAPNAASVAYCDDNGQLLDTLPVCRDFKSGQCKRPQCRYVHLVEEFVEVVEGKVTVCRDAAKGRCARPLCKYYHVPALSLSPL